MKNRPLCAVCLILFLGICSGVVLGKGAVVKELRPSGTELWCKEGETVSVTGTVYQKTEKEDYDVIYLKDNLLKYQQRSLKESKIIIYNKSKKRINIGNYMKAVGELRFFEEAGNPGNFNQKLYYQREDIHCCVWADDVQATEGKAYLWYERMKNGLLKLREQQRENFCKVLGRKRGNILAAVLLGEKAGMDQEVKELYQVNGIGHILAISGLHLSFIGVGTYQFFRRRCGSYIAGGTVGICFLSLYIMMIGLTVSALRAGIMFLFRVGADMTGRNYDSITALSFSAAAVLLWRPLSVFDGGFFMSFGAVLAVIVLLPAFRDMICQPFWASVSINLMLLPVLFYSFFEFSPYSILLNIIVIPLMSLLLLSGITGGILFFFIPSAGELILQGAGIILWLYEKLCHLALCAPGARIVVGQPEYWQIAVYYVFLILAAFFWRKKKGKPQEKRKFISGLCLMAGLFLLSFRFSDIGNGEITMIDVGQGDSFFVRGPSGGTYLIDGGSSDRKQTGRYNIEPFLKSRGVRILDYVFVSHGDADHLNGIMEMAERKKTGIEIRTLVFPVEEVWGRELTELAKKARQEGIRIVTVKPGDTITEKKGLHMKIRCLGPGKEFEGEPGNAASMILSLELGTFRMLFTGDVEEEGEKDLTRILEDEGKAYNVLKVAHHGSKNSSSEQFLKAVSPDVMLISAGEDNRYGHPHKDTAERLRKTGGTVCCTAQAGAVTLKVYRSKYQVDSFVKQLN